MKRLILIPLGAFAGIFNSLLYMILSYTIGDGNIPQGVEYYSLFNTALAGFAVMIILTAVIFFLIRKKVFYFALPFAISSAVFGTVSFIILSSIHYNF